MIDKCLIAGLFALGLLGCEDTGSTGAAADAGGGAGGSPSSDATGGGGGGDDTGGGAGGGGDTGGGGPGDPVGSIAIVDTCDLGRDETGTKHQTHRDVEWATLGGEPLLMNIARPTAAGLHPLVVFVHGGGWTYGDRTAYDGTIETVAANGFVAASVDYRLAGEAGNRFPTAVQDVRCAIRWLRDNAATYGIDPERVAIVGGSAGGHLAALVGLAPDEEEFDGECPATGSADVSAIAAFYGPFDLRASAYGGHEVGQWNVEILLGAMAKDAPDLAAKASPLLYVDANDPPVLLSHGDADIDVPYSQSETLLAALVAAGVPSALVTVPGAEHGYAPDDADPLYQRSSCTFLQFLRDTLTD